VLQVLALATLQVKVTFAHYQKKAGKDLFLINRQFLLALLGIMI